MARRKRRPRRFEVHWVDVPETHSRGSEYRNSDNGNPRAWVVISEERTQQAGVVVVVPLTRGTPKSIYQVQISAGDIKQIGTDQGAPEDCVACCEHIRSLAVSRFKSRLGKLDNTKGAEIEGLIMQALKLPTE